VSRIDPATNKVVATIPLDSSPASIAAGVGSVFVASSLDLGLGEVGVSLIDPRTNKVINTSRVNGLCQGTLALAEGSVWVSSGQVVARVEPATGHILGEFNPGVTLFGITVGDGSVWTAYGGLPARVLRLDAAGKQVEQEIPVGNSRGNPAGFGGSTSCPSISLAVGNGSLWVANVDDGTISQIVTISSEAVNTVAVGKRLTGLAIGQGGLWVTVDAP
jgi:hypothetical protein